MTTWQMLTLTIGLLLIGLSVAEYWKPQASSIL